MSEQPQDDTTLGDIPPSLASLFDRDPLSLTRAEKNSIIEVLRTQRKNFQAAESEARTAGKRVNAKAAIKTGSAAIRPDLKSMLDLI